MLLGFFRFAPKSKTELIKTGKGGNMAKDLSKLKESWSAQQVINALRLCKDKRLVLYNAGKGHGQGWRIEGTDYTGSIPIGSHGANRKKCT
jgi:hypothetical protein